MKNITEVEGFLFLRARLGLNVVGYVVLRGKRYVSGEGYVST